jgi:hypothetical protein
MKEYPSLKRELVRKKVYAFDKLDGSQIRAEWEKKKKFWKFGTRKQMMDETHPNFGQAVELIRNKYERSLSDIFVKERFQKVMCFFEFRGEHSFAGRHEDEPHDVTLFDVRVHKKGIMLPKDFLKLVGDLDIPRMLYYGNANELLVEAVRNGTLEGMTFEGVVCKAQEYHTPGIPLMFKLKSQAWLSKLKEYCKGDDNLYKILS